MIVPKHYENLNVLHENTMPNRAYYIPAAERMDQLVEDRTASNRMQLLNGQWKFRYYNSIYDLKEVVENSEKKWKLVKTVLDSGHESIAEVVNFTFAIEGVSRVLLAQITRHRTGVVFQVQSQRYVEFKESYDTLTEAFDKGTEQQEQYLKSIAEKYFTDVTSDNYRDYIQALINYLGAIKRGTKAEDARMILPNATKTNIVMTVNLRQLMHMCNLRLCMRAQSEIRSLFKFIKIEVETYNSKLNSLLVPTCFKLGYCPEHKGCGLKPTKEEVLEGYYKYEALDY